MKKKTKKQKAIASEERRCPHVTVWIYGVPVHGAAEDVAAVLLWLPGVEGSAP